MSEIRSIRECLSLTQRQFGDRMGVSQSVVSRWETHKAQVRERDLLAARQLLAQERALQPVPVAAAEQGAGAVLVICGAIAAAGA